MQAELKVNCGACGRYLGMVQIDTATMPNELQERINRVILAHRQACPSYGSGSGRALVSKSILKRL